MGLLASMQPALKVLDAGRRRTSALPLLPTHTVNSSFINFTLKFSPISSNYFHLQHFVIEVVLIWITFQH